MAMAHTIEKKDGVFLCAVIALGIALRLPGIDAPLAHDELANASIWAQMPFAKIVSNYQYPNNHIFLTLILAALLKVFGVNEVALRIPVLTCGILSIFLVYITTRRIARTSLIALGTAFLLAISTQHIYYSTNARGYMLLMVISQIILHRMLVWLQDESLASGKNPLFDILIAAGLCFLGTWTVPTFVLFEASLGLIFILALLGDLKMWRRIAPIFLTLFICLCGFYIQYFVFISKDMLKMGMTNSAADGNRLPDLFPGVLNEWIHPFEPSLPMLVVLGLLGMILMFKSNRDVFYLLASIILVPPVGAAALYVMGALSSVPHARVFIYLQPFFFTAVAIGGYFVVESACRLLTSGHHFAKWFYAVLFVPLVFFSANELNGQIYREREGREPFHKVLRFIEKLGPRDLILASEKPHVGFYLYGASEMRKRVENIIDTQTLGDIYFLVYRHNNGSDMQVVRDEGVDYFKFLDYAGTPENRGLLVPAELFQLAARFDNFEFYKVKPQYVQTGSKLKTIADMENWVTTGPSAFRLEPFKTSAGTEAAVRGSAFLASRNSVDNGFLSINLVSTTADILYVNARLEGNRFIVNQSWLANDWTLDHPYGRTIFNRSWRPIIYLSESRASFEVIQQTNQGGLFRGLQSYQLGTRTVQE